MQIREFLKTNWDCLLRPSRSRELANGMSSSLIASCLDVLQQQIELSCHESWWHEGSCLDLAPSRAVKKCRVMSNAYKDDVLTAVRTAEEPQSVRSLISAQWIFRGDPVSAPDSSRQAGRMVKDEMLRYLGHGRQVFRNPRSLHLSVDGVAAGGDHQNVFFAWLPVKRLAGVPPLQDWRVGKHVLYV
mgnify:CR=1 FL=1